MSNLTRSQQLNVADALEKLRTLIRRVSIDPQQLSKESLELLRKRQLKAARERVLIKRKHSDIKQTRLGVTNKELLE